MKYRKLREILLLAVWISFGVSQVHAATRLAPDPDYPIKDRFAATVIGTPLAYRAVLPKEIPVKQFRLPSLHTVPDIYWYDKGLSFSVALQKRSAPLIFNIAGTGADFDSAKMLMMQKALYQAGFHVINLPSPTHLNFQINASRSNLPGYLPDDAEDIYRVMEQAYNKVKDEIEVSEFHITGYSLGAAHAAFVTELDRSRQVFNIQKLYMINPPVSLYNSVSILDQLLVDNVEGGVRGVGAFINKVVNRLAASYDPKHGMRFDGDFLYEAYSSWPPSERGPNANGRDGAAGLIGVSFRFTSAAMVFTGDLMSELSYIIPEGTVIKQREPLPYYAQASHVVKFTDYINDMVIPDLKTRYPGRSREDFLRAASLYHIEDFLSTYPQVRVVTNRNEVILAKGELEYMEGLLGDRIKVYDYGGHCGNMDSKENVAHMIAFFKGES